MVLSLSNVQEAMKGLRMADRRNADIRSGIEVIMRDLYVLAGYDPELFQGQLDDLARDLASGFPKLTLEEVKLAGKAGIAGELGGPKKPSYSAMMQWTEAYHRSAMVADARKIRKAVKEEPRKLTPEEGLALMKRTMPEAAMRRWEDVRTTGTFGKGLVMHVSAQIYDWLGEEGVLHLSQNEREDAMNRARKETPKTTVWSARHLENEKERVRNQAKHYALETWMRNQYASGQGLTLPQQVRRIYQ